MAIYLHLPPNISPEDGFPQLRYLPAFNAWISPEARPCCAAFGAPCVGGAWTSSSPIDALMKANKNLRYKINGLNHR